MSVPKDYESFINASTTDSSIATSATCANKAKIDVIDKICSILLVNAESIADTEVRTTGMGKASDKARLVREHTRIARSLCFSESADDVVYTPKGVVAALIGLVNATSFTVDVLLKSIYTGNRVYFVPHPRISPLVQHIVELVSQVAPENSMFIEPTVNAEVLKSIHSSEEFAYVVNCGLGSSHDFNTSSHFQFRESNTSAIVESSADFSAAVESIIHSVSFDNGSYPSSEGSIIAVEESTSQRLVETFSSNSDSYVVPDTHIQQLTELLRTKDDLINHETIGKSASHIASLIGLEIPESTRILVVQATDDKSDPLLRWKRCPVVGIVSKPTVAEASAFAREIVLFDDKRAVFNIVLFCNHHTRPGIPNEVARITRADSVLVNISFVNGSILYGSSLSLADSRVSLEHRNLQICTSIRKFDDRGVIKITQQRKTFPCTLAPLVTDELVTDASTRIALEMTVCIVEEAMHKELTPYLTEALNASLKLQEKPCQIDCLVPYLKSSEVSAVLKQGEGRFLHNVKKAARVINASPVELYAITFESFLNHKDAKLPDSIKKEVLLSTVENTAEKLGFRKELPVHDCKKVYKKNVPEFAVFNSSFINQQYSSTTPRCDTKTRTKKTPDGNSTIDVAMSKTVFEEVVQVMKMK